MLRLLELVITTRLSEFNNLLKRIGICYSYKLRKALVEIFTTNKNNVTTKSSNLQYSGSSSEYCRFENLVVTLYLLVTTNLNKASRNFIHF